MSNESLITRDSSLTSYVNSLPASFTAGNASDLKATKLGKPEVAIGSGCDTLYLVAITGCGKLGDRPVGRDTPDIGVAKLGKPEIAIGSDCDKLRETQ